jgi:uncharacterized membrane protein
MAAAVVIPVSLLAFVIGIGQIAFGTLLGIIPLLIGVIGVVYRSGGIAQITGENNYENTERTQQDEVPTEDALAIIRNRYARSEIDQTEFDRRLDHLLETETLEGAADYRDREPTVERSQ